MTFLYSGRLEIASNLREILQQLFSDVFRIDADLRMPDLNSPRKKSPSQNPDIPTPDNIFPANYSHPVYDHADQQDVAGNEAAEFVDLTDVDESAVLGENALGFNFLVVT